MNNVNQKGLLRIVSPAVDKDDSLSDTALRESPKTFNLSIKTSQVKNFLESESIKSGASRTAFINEVLFVLSECPDVFSSSTESSLKELEAFRTLISDKVMSNISELAATNRREPVQMALYLMEKGLEAIESGSVPN